RCEYHAQPQSFPTDALPIWPTCRAQEAQQKMRPETSTPCPRMRQPQCPHVGAMAWTAHSKLSKVPVRSPWVTVKVLSYSLPHTSDRKSTRLNSSHVKISYAV